MATLANVAMILLAPIAIFLGGMSNSFAPPQPHKWTLLYAVNWTLIFVGPVVLAVLAFALNFYTWRVRMEIAFCWFVAVIGLSLFFLACVT